MLLDTECSGFQHISARFLVWWNTSLANPAELPATAFVIHMQVLRTVTDASHKAGNTAFESATLVPVGAPTCSHSYTMTVTSLLVINTQITSYTRV